MFRPRELPERRARGVWSSSARWFDHRLRSRHAALVISSSVPLDDANRSASTDVVTERSRESAPVGARHRYFDDINICRLGETRNPR
ncbi:hypothetical protein YM304_05970 [Ilumatobacter coccineus YM16-304]|uniref:Uncharacterized protein n=1 Tax=Ilumatobacter coccineus (strain NBRC 103263 / KCTC 29153 / YM16-304) TaxID=1313172 RepID=A0A6C7E241_ILUCY|nr:hypothetical protein YM304_05970 [Ilumatobacter coccineus YM16-304]